MVLGIGMPVSWSVHHFSPDLTVLYFNISIHNILYRYSWFPEDESCWLLMIPQASSTTMSLTFYKMSWQLLDGLPWYLLQSFMSSSRLQNIPDPLTFPLALSSSQEFNLSKIEVKPASSFRQPNLRCCSSYMVYYPHWKVYPVHPYNHVGVFTVSCQYLAHHLLYAY